MTLEKRIGKYFGLNTEEDWKKHANPVSVWTRFIILPILVLSIWSRVWLGWYALIPIFLILLWTFINPKFFNKPKSFDNWGSKSVLGERAWANRDESEVSSHHKTPILILTILQAIGGVFLFIGLYKLLLWPTVLGTVVIYLGKMWFLDRMVWIFDDTKNRSGNNIKKYNHIGIPTTKKKESEIHLPHLKMFVTDHEKSSHKIQWMRFEKDAPYPALVLTVPHIAFEVDNLEEALKGQKVIIEPNSPSPGLVVAFIEDNGAPVELMQYM